MEETGEVARLDGRYRELSVERSQGHMQRPSQGNGQIKQGDAHQTSGHATPGGGSRDDHDGTTQRDATDYRDYTDDTPPGPCRKEGNPGEAHALLEPGGSITACKVGPILHGEWHLQLTAVL